MKCKCNGVPLFTQGGGEPCNDDATQEDGYCDHCRVTRCWELHTVADLIEARRRQAQAKEADADGIQG